MENITLRRINKDDVSQLAIIANNKKVWDNLRDIMPNPYNEKDAIVFVELTEKEDPYQTFGIVDEKDTLCGIIGLVQQTDVYRLTAEIGYWLGEDYWGKGIITKAIKLITQYGFEDLKLERIQAGVFDYNVASMKVLEKNGYKKEGVFRNSVVKNDQIYDEHRYAILKDEYYSF